MPRMWADGGINEALLDNKYLRLDASNDPVTGQLLIETPIGIALQSTGITDASNDTVGLKGIATVHDTATAKTAYGIKGISSTTHAGGNNIGVYGTANSALVSYGFYGSAFASSIAYGIYGTTSGVATTNYGIYGNITATGTNNYGIYGQCTGAGTTNYGVYGTSSGAGTNYAGYFIGLTTVQDQVGRITPAAIDIFRVYGTNVTFENTNFFLKPATGSAINVYEDAYGAGSNWFFRRANGTKAAPTNVSNGTILSRLHWQGYYGGTYYDAAQMYVRISAPVSGSAETPGTFILATTADGATTATECMIIDHNQNFGFGYAYGTTPAEKVDINGNLQIGSGAAGIDYYINFNGETNDGSITWMEDEARFDFSHPIKMANVKNGATQGAAGAAAGEVWATNGHGTLPDNVLMIGV